MNVVGEITLPANCAVLALGPGLEAGTERVWRVSALASGRRQLSPDHGNKLHRRFA